MAGSILGNAVLRLEDPRFLRGAATYIDNIGPEGVLRLDFVRSPFAHARIRSIDTSAAEELDGVVATFTASSLGLAPHQVFVTVHDDFARQPLAVDTVRFVGEPVVAVLAVDRRSAADALAAVVVDYEPLDAVVDAEAAFDPTAPALFEGHPDNVCFSQLDPYDDTFFDDADVVVRGRYVNQRLAVVPMEPNACAAVPTDDGRMTVYLSTQMPHLAHGILAGVLGVDKERLRIVAPDVGGGFGGKAGLYPEYSVVARAAQLLGRPVTWTESRSDNMVGLAHGRAQVQYVELGCRSDGRFTGLRARIVGDAGAYPGIGAMLPGATRRMSQAVYALPKLSVDLAVAVTSTTPTGAYRGAGRPEAASMVERIVDQAAHELGIDPAEIRRRNLLGDDVFPYTTHTGVVYDSGAYAKPLAEALRLAGYDELRAEQARRRAAGDPVLLGIGVSCYVEITAGGAAGEFASVTVETDGSATVRVGTSGHGQGHPTSFAMIVADRLGIPMDRVRLVQSDTDEVRSGGGTGGSKSLQLGGTAVYRASEALLDKARALAAHLLECDAADVVVHDDGRLGVAGVPARALGWAELAVAAADPSLPVGVVDHGDGTAGLAAQLDFVSNGPTFPFGAHVAVVEVDRETGRVVPVRHVAVDDCGTVLNPVLVAGQQHGGVASGIGQALYEEFRYDDAGNPLTATLADYALPSAAEFPFFEVASTETPTPYNPLGAKGIGEAGTIGATPAVQNAVVDALAHLGVRHVDMPLRAETVWHAIRAAEAGSPEEPWREPPAIFDRLRSAGGGPDAVSSVEEAEGV